MTALSVARRHLLNIFHKSITSSSHSSRDKTCDYSMSAQCGGIRPPEQIWVESMESPDQRFTGICEINSDIFATYPRIDILHNNVVWQTTYRKIDYRFLESRAEKRGGGRKPWPQKRTGRAAQGSIRAPHFVGGGAAKGPRGPKSYFYMLPFFKRVLGLRVALTVKHSQKLLFVVENLNFPSDDPKFLEDFVKDRDWGLSVLFICENDSVDPTMAACLNRIEHFNIMPYYGLNVYSMLKHEALVMTLPALRLVEAKLLEAMRSFTVSG